MGFSLSSFLGGAAGAGSRGIEKRRDTLQREKETAEARQWQIATESRADSRAKKAARVSETKATEEQASYLTSLGWDDKSVKSILKGGKNSIEQWGKIGATHRSSGKDFNVNLLIRDLDPVNTTTIKTAQNDVAPAKVGMTSAQAWTEFTAKAEPVFKDLNNAFDFYQNKADNATGSKKAGFQLQADNALKSLKTKAQALEDEGADVSSIYNDTTITTIMDKYINQGLASVEFSTDRETGTITRQEGDLGRHAIGTLNGIQLTKEFNTKDDGLTPEDSNFSRTLNLAEKQQYNNLKVHAQKAVGKQAGYITQYKTEKRVHEILGLNVPPAESEGFISAEVLDTAISQGLFTFGDVVKTIQKDGTRTIAVYTGFTTGDWYAAYALEE